MNITSQRSTKKATIRFVRLLKPARFYKLISSGSLIFAYFVKNEFKHVKGPTLHELFVFIKLLTILATY